MQTLRGLVGGAKPAAKPEPRQAQPKPREPPPKPAPRGGDDSYLGGMDLPSSESESDEERERYRPNYTPEDKATHLQTSVRGAVIRCLCPAAEGGRTGQVAVQEMGTLVQASAHAFLSVACLMWLLARREGADGKGQLREAALPDQEHQGV